MTEYHVATDQLDPDTGEVATTYLGTCTQEHADEVRAIAALPDTERWVKDHPRQAGAFAVLRDDGDLDVYVPTDAPEFRIYEPDQEPKSLGPEDLPRGATGPAYITGAVRFGSQSIGGAMDHPESGPRFTWHTTESPAGAAYFSSVALYLIRVASEPQVIYDPVSDKLGQFGPLNQSGRALKNDGGRRTNREGTVNIQVEVLGRAASPWTNGFDAAKKPNFQKLLAAGRAWGVPDDWPAGKPPAYPSGKSSRSRMIWQSKPGHYAHAQVPGNDHGDPGAIDTAVVPGKPSQDTGGGSTPSTSTYTVKKGDTLSSIAKAHGTTVAKLVSLNGLKDADHLAVGQKLKLPATKPAAPQYEPFPGSSFFHGGRHSPIITAMGRRLVALGFGKHYKNGPGPDWTNADRDNVRDFQLSRDDLKGDADGFPGPKTWAALKVPKL
ncbi:LysM peptidoglycan-binding domain-containing protein [Streptomyces olivaceoviridis]|uniref:LysM peptidoglycan-binding domain-containing protein n=1 Tax=Streptomyces olivaceoviridis TaxID=1921 RepID=UPI0036F4DBBD